MTKKDEKLAWELAGSDEYIKEAKVIVALFKKGVDKKVVKEYSGVKRGFMRIWNNLKKNHYFENGKIILSEDFDKYEGIELILMILCAAGFIERKLNET
jgi:hypothetical protein